MSLFNKKILVICAPQTLGINLGMSSVDYAGYLFLKNKSHHAEITMSSLFKCPETSTLPYQYKYLIDEPNLIVNADVIIYWGDFMHMLDYKLILKTFLVKHGFIRNQVLSEDFLRKTLYLTDIINLNKKKIIIFGGTLLFNGLAPYQDETYNNDLCRLYQNAHEVLMREPFSALKVAEIRKDYNKSFIGLDLAFLINDKRTSDSTELCGIFFGRCRIEGRRIAEFVEQFCKKMNLPIEWINWGTAPFFIDRKVEFKNIFKNDISFSVQLSIEKLDKQLSKYKYIITDTYHVCVNAWRLNIPAICIINNSKTALLVNSGGHLINRDKRITLFWMFDLMRFLIYEVDLNDTAWLKDKVCLLKKLISEEDLLNIAFKRIQTHTELIKQRLLASLD